MISLHNLISHHLIIFYLVYTNIPNLIFLSQNIILINNALAYIINYYSIAILIPIYQYSTIKSYPFYIRNYIRIELLYKVL